MDKKLIAAGTLASLIAATSIVGFASAQSTAVVNLTEEQAIALALAEVPGEVQETELESEDGMDVYEIEILTAEGVEMEVEIDANSGEILEVEAEDDHDCDDDDDDGEDA